MSDIDLFDRLEHNDRYRSSQPLPQGWSAEATLEDLGRRISAADAAAVVGLENRSNPNAVRAAAFATVVTSVVFAVGLLGLWLGTGRGPAAITPDSAVAVAEDFFAAYDDGDVARLIGLLTPDAEIQGLTAPDEVEHAWTFATAAEARVGDVTCTAIEAGPTTAVVVCDYEWADALIDGLGAEAAAERSIMTVTSDGIDALSIEVKSGPFGDIGAAFNSWLFATDRLGDLPDRPPSTVHSISLPKIIDAASGELVTVQEARDAGRQWAQYAEEWIAFLEEHDCTYGTQCFLETPATAGQ